jgi:hypothetical protein
LTAFVAFIIGTFDIILYSPNGKCLHKLTPNLPRVLDISGQSVLGIIADEKILACGGTYNYNCYLYDVVADQWSIYSTSHYDSTEHPGVFHKGKFYLSHDSNPQVFDPSTKTWSTWPVSPERSLYACLVSWNDVIIQIGGWDTGTRIFSYNPATNTWTNMNAPAPPKGLFYMSCLILPNMNVLVAGLQHQQILTSYNVTSNTWGLNITTALPVDYSSLVLLGSRSFIVPYYSSFMEFSYNNQSVTVTDTNFLTRHAYYPGVVAVPDAWFSYLPGGCVGVK